LPGAKRAAPRAWSTEEHDAFLAGLAALGRGRWSTLSRGYVPGRSPAQASPLRVLLVATFCSRARWAARRHPNRLARAHNTHTTLLTNHPNCVRPRAAARQVASHAQKYFLRLEATKRRRVSDACESVRASARHATTHAVPTHRPAWARGAFLGRRARGAIAAADAYRASPARPPGVRQAHHARALRRRAGERVAAVGCAIAHRLGQLFRARRHTRTQPPP
jgi:hypothetical protein